MDFTALFRRERRYIHLSTLLGVLACACLLSALRNRGLYAPVSYTHLTLPTSLEV